MTKASVATRYECSLRNEPMSGYHHSSGNGKPRSKRCTYCRGSLVVMTGLWGVFDWTGENRYPLSDAIKTFVSPAAADRFADAAPTRVVRWIFETLV